MKKLSKIKLSDIKFMDAQEMKMILGGQYADDCAELLQEVVALLKLTKVLVF